MNRFLSVFEINFYMNNVLAVVIVIPEPCVLYVTKWMYRKGAAAIFIFYLWHVVHGALLLNFMKLNTELVNNRGSIKSKIMYTNYSTVIY